MPLGKRIRKAVARTTKPIRKGLRRAQRVIIPRNVLRGNRTNVIEIPPAFQDSQVVVVTPRRRTRVEKAITEGFHKLRHRIAPSPELDRSYLYFGEWWSPSNVKQKTDMMPDFVSQPQSSPIEYNLQSSNPQDWPKHLRPGYFSLTPPFWMAHHKLMTEKPRDQWELSKIEHDLEGYQVIRRNLLRDLLECTGIFAKTEPADYTFTSVATDDLEDMNLTYQSDAYESDMSGVEPIDESLERNQAAEQQWANLSVRSGGIMNKAALVCRK